MAHNDNENEIDAALRAKVEELKKREPSAKAADADIEDFFKVLPQHICMSIRHNPHAGDYMTVEKWLEHRDLEGSGADIKPEDRAEMLRTGEVWEISWCPRTPVGSCWVAAASLYRALELAGE